MNDYQRRCLALAPATDSTGRSARRCDASDPVLVRRVVPNMADDDLLYGPAWGPRVSRETGKPEKPVVRCVCGLWCRIALHGVAADGRLTAVFYHATPEALGPERAAEFGDDGCGWRVFIMLDGYDQGDFPPEPRKPTHHSPPASANKEPE